MRGRIHIRALVQFVQWNEDIEPARDDEADGSDDHDEMRHGKGGNMQGIITLLIESWVGKGYDDGEDGRRDVTEDDTPRDGDLPLVPCSHDEVQVSTELINL